MAVVAGTSAFFYLIFNILRLPSRFGLIEGHPAMMGLF